MSSTTAFIQSAQNPLLVVVMGVSGTGKSTLAREIAEHLELHFLDADALHSDTAIQQMSQGIPLSDEQRAPWIARICRQLRQFESQLQGCVLAYSGLKQGHRELIFDCYPKSLGILLKADADLITQRLQARSNHFMSAQLLSSQIAAMEPLHSKMAHLILTLDPADSVQRLLLLSLNFIKPSATP